MLDLRSGYAPYYAERAAEKERARQVGWRDLNAQHKRFEQLARAITHGTESQFEVADVGCGLGDFLPYLRGRGFARFHYSGYDIIPEMVSAAAGGHRDGGAKFGKIDHIEQIAPADYCFASGIFNARLGYSDEAWWSHVQSCVRDMAGKSRSAAAFNMLSLYSDEEKRDSSLYYADPCLMFDWCKRQITPDVALLHDYGQWDFTIILRMDRLP